MRHMKDSLGAVGPIQTRTVEHDCYRVERFRAEERGRKTSSGNMAVDTGGRFT